MASPGEATLKCSHVGKKKKVTRNNSFVRRRNFNRVERLISSDKAGYDSALQMSDTTLFTSIRQLTQVARVYEAQEGGEPKPISCHK